MTREEILRIMETEHARERELFLYKNGIYANVDDALVNFKKAASLLDTTPEKYLLSLVTKHFLALITNAQLTPETVDEYTRDIRVYMLLLKCLLLDGQFKHSNH